MTGDERAIADDLAELVRLVECLAPSHRNPEAFHEAKSEIVFRLRRSALALTGQHTPPPQYGHPRLGPITSDELKAARVALTGGPWCAAR